MTALNSGLQVEDFVCEIAEMGHVLDRPLRYVQINSVPNGSTGSVMRSIHEGLTAKGVESYLEWGRRRGSNLPYEHNFGTTLEINPFDAILSILDEREGFHSKEGTRRLLARLDEIDPDVVHLHNLHGYYVNIEMLFGWLASHRCQVRWTLHDCWAFTGHCAYFTYAKCAQWQSHCAYLKSCPQLGAYPKTISKASCKWNFEQKKRLFNLVPTDRMRLITPSEWLAELVGKSFLAKYPVDVRHNIIDRTVFKPTPSDFRERYGIGDRFMVLGVASPWTERKGIDDFIRLSHDLDQNRYVIVLVGLSPKQIKRIKGNVLAMLKTESKEELAEIYTAADVFFNPTIEDNYPTVNLEAESCGTPVVTYDTGGCRETVSLHDSVVAFNYKESVKAIESMAGVR